MEYYCIIKKTYIRQEDLEDWGRLGYVGNSKLEECRHNKARTKVILKWEGINASDELLLLADWVGPREQLLDKIELDPDWNYASE